VTIRESSFRETSCPGKKLSGKRLSGKRLSAKVTVRETTVYHYIYGIALPVSFCEKLVIILFAAACFFAISHWQAIVFKVDLKSLSKKEMDDHKRVW